MGVKRDRPVVKVVRPFQAFADRASSGGILLIAATMVALVWANSPWGDIYSDLWQTKLTVGFEGFSLTKDLTHWINDGLMAVFYTSDISWTALAVGAAFLVALVGANVAGVGKPLIYGLLGIGLWLAFLKSGVHATIAGVLLAMTVPASSYIDTGLFLKRSRGLLDRFEQAGERGGDPVLSNEERQGALHALNRANEDVEPPLQELEHALHPWVVFAIMPLFALANAGVLLGEDFTSTLLNPVSVGIVAGLLLGKQVGITLFVWLAVKSGVSEMPQGVTWMHIYGASWLAGIGFTMSLFISDLAFADSPLLNVAKLGILAASVIAGITGWSIIRRTSAPHPDGEG